MDGRVEAETLAVCWSLPVAQPSWCYRALNQTADGQLVKGKTFSNVSFVCVD